MKSTVIPLQSLKAHEKPITSLCIGQRTGLVYATGGEDSNLNLWMVGNLSPIVCLGPFPSPVTSCIFSDSENEICCGNQGGSVILFDLNSSKILNNWSSHPSAINCLCYNPADRMKTWYSCGDDGTIRVLSTSSKTPIKTIRAHDGPVNFLTISPDGCYAASAGKDKKVKIFDLNTFSEIQTFTKHTDSATCVQFHPKLPLLISGGCDRIPYLYDTEKMQPIETNFPHHPSKIVSVKFSADIPYLAGAFSDDCISFYSVLDPVKHLERIQPQSGHIHDAVLLPNPKGPGENAIIASSLRERAILTRIKISELIFDETPKSKPFDRPKDVSDMSSLDVYKMFKKERNPFLSQLNGRIARINRLTEVASSKGLPGVLDEAQTNTETSADLLSLLNQRKEILKLEHASPLLSICAGILKSPSMVTKSKVDLAVDTINDLLTSFGKSVYTNLKMAEGKVDIAFEERKQKSENFVRSLKLCAPGLRSAAKGGICSSSSARKAQNIMDEWSPLLK